MLKTFKSKPLWIITFDQNKGSNNWLESARMNFTTPSIEELLSSKNNEVALEFLEMMNSSFRQITDNYLKQAEKDENLRGQVEEIRKKFDSLDNWLHMIRKWVESASKEKPKKQPEDQVP